MARGIPSLLGLLFFLGHRTWAQSGSSSPPSIRAVPGAIVPQGSSVTILCRIPSGTTRLCLYHTESRMVWSKRHPWETEEVEFSLMNTAQDHAGTYYCEYWILRAWTGRSDPLELVVTGSYKYKPFLTARPGPQVASGGNVTFFCRTHYSFETFILCRDGDASVPQDCSHQDHDTFFISFVAPAHSGIYVCYGSFRRYLWTLPSNPLELSVTGPPSFIITGVSVAAVFLLLFLFLFLFLCLRLRRRHHHHAKLGSTDGGNNSQVKYKSSSSAVDIQKENIYEHIQPEDDGRMDTQVPAMDDAQEVIYAQLDQETLTESAAFLDESTQSCVYASLA